jgi:GH24 family phage-related lysozyme (muramidase)
VANYLEQSLAKLKEFEGCVPWMYRDTVGKVTVGVGLMLPDATSAEALPFVLGGRLATPVEIAAEFTRIDAMAMGRLPAFYRSAASPELSQETIDARLGAVLLGFEADLRSRISHYDGLPDGAKMALLDMIYNLGPAGLFHGFPHLMAAVESGSWAEAAACCLRRGPSPERNAWTREQFLSAVVSTIKAEAESWLTRIRRGLRLMMSRISGRLR